MIWIFILLIIVVCIATTAYPLFKGELQTYKITTSDYDFAQEDSWLSALSDLEDDLDLERISECDYQKQKLFLQHGYLKCKK